MLRSIKHPREKGTSKVKRTKTRPPLSVTADGKGIASHAGTRLLAEMADFTGLSDSLSEVLAPTVRRSRRHDPGRVLLDLALTLADGGDCLSDLSVLRDQPTLFGPVASTPTASRVIDTVDAARLGAIRAARAQARARAWAAGLSPVTKHGPLILDFDATLVDAHSERTGAGPTYKGGYGFHPLACFCDATKEALAMLLRPGNAAAHDVDDHIAVSYTHLLRVVERSQVLESCHQCWRESALLDFEHGACRGVDRLWGLRRPRSWTPKGRIVGSRSDGRQRAN